MPRRRWGLQWLLRLRNELGRSSLLMRTVMAQASSEGTVPRDTATKSNRPGETVQEACISGRSLGITREPEDASGAAFTSRTDFFLAVSVIAKFRAQYVAMGKSWIWYQYFLSEADTFVWHRT